MKILSIWGIAMLIAGFFVKPPLSHGAAAIKLPPPVHKGKVSVEETLARRRTIRQFAARPLELSQVSQCLWATQGLSDPRGLRTAPSAGATYPLEIYLVVGERGVTGLAAGVYHYQPHEHALLLVFADDVRTAVARVSLHQTWMAEAPVMVVIAAEYARCMARYGDRGIRYTHMEVGHAGQNLFLQAEALGLGAGIVGAFDDRGLAQTLKLPRNHEPLLVMPVGYKY